MSEQPLLRRVQRVLADGFQSAQGNEQTVIFRGGRVEHPGNSEGQIEFGMAFIDGHQVDHLLRLFQFPSTGDKQRLFEPIGGETTPLRIGLENRLGRL